MTLKAITGRNGTASSVADKEMQASSQTNQPETVTVPVAQTCSLPYCRLAVYKPPAPGIFCLALICLLLLIWPSASHGQTNAPRNSLHANRYLLVIESSRAMRNRADGIATAVQELIGSGMKGQMRSGDTLGVWTFNDELHTGQIPLQDWAPEGQGPITEKLCSFVRKLHYEKQGRLSNTLPTLLRLVKSSEFITVVLISEGTEEIHGTPFDTQINQSLKAWTTQQREAKMPVVTVLRATRGTITHYAVAPVPWPIDIPPLPNELQLAKVSTNQPAASTPKKAPAAPVPPLIVKGKKPEPLPNPTSAESGSTKREAARVDAIPTPVAAETKSLAFSSTTNIVVAAVVHPTVPATTVHTEPSPQPGHTPSQRPEPGLVAEKVLPPQNHADPSPTAASASITPLTNSAPAPQSNAPAVSASGPSSTQPPKSLSPDTSASPQPDLGAVAPGSPLFTVTTVAVGAIFFLAAGSLIWFRKRRPAPAPHISLITRSFEREKQ
jgi:hypothetical protein